MRPQNCQAVERRAAAPAARAAATAAHRQWRVGAQRRAPAAVSVSQPATALMRAIISSTALSTGTFSLRMRFIALAQTFSLLSTVNL